MKVFLARDMRETNSLAAQANRHLFERLGLPVVNLIGSPGAGKTTLLARTLERWGPEMTVGIIEGDIATARDAEILAPLARGVVQINTEGACHLEASWISTVLEQLPVAGLDLLCIENVGNLVCPAEFDLGEDLKVAVLSTAEGGDKPSKYPLVFHEAGVVVITKMDLAPYVDFDLEAVTRQLQAINPHVQIFPLAATSGTGMEEWCRWLREWSGKKRRLASATG